RRHLEGGHPCGRGFHRQRCGVAEAPAVAGVRVIGAVGGSELRQIREDYMKHLDRTHILTRIVEAKQKRLQVARMRVPEAVVKRMAATAAAGPSFREALETPQRVRLIAEIKKASPSKGVLNPNLDVERQAAIYTEAGACAISVVTEEDFFEGDLGWISRIKQVSSLPVLRKDFIFDAFQIHETR